MSVGSKGEARSTGGNVDLPDTIVDKMIKPLLGDKQTREQAFADALKFTQEKFDEGFSPVLRCDHSTGESLGCHTVKWFERNRKRRNGELVGDRIFGYYYD